MNTDAWQRFNLAVTSVYDAVLDPSAADHCLQQILSFADASAGSMLRVSAQGDLLELTARNHSPAAQLAYSSHYHALDPGVARLVSSQPGSWIMDTDTFDPQQRAHHEYVHDFCFRHDIRWAAGVKVHQDERQFTILSVQRGLGTASFREDGERALNLLLPHVHRAAELKARLGSAVVDGSVLSAMLDRLVAPAFAVSATARVVFANQAAQDLLSGSDLFRVHAMHLSATDTRLNDLLIAAVRRACSSPCAGSVFTADLATSVHGLQLHVTPIAPRLAETSFAPEPMAMLVIGEAASSAPDAPTLQALLDITRAQAQLTAGLSAGDDLATISRRMGITLATARSHLARVFERTGTHSQSALVALTRRLPGIRR